MQAPNASCLPLRAPSHRVRAVNGRRFTQFPCCVSQGAMSYTAHEHEPCMIVFYINMGLERSRTTCNTRQVCSRQGQAERLSDQRHAPRSRREISIRRTPTCAGWRAMLIGCVSRWAFFQGDVGTPQCRGPGDASCLCCGVRRWPVSSRSDCETGRRLCVRIAEGSEEPLRRYATAIVCNAQAWSSTEGSCEEPNRG